jgi:hypothetical protein
MVEHIPEPWQRLRDEFHMMIGYCIVAWSEVDNELFNIFHECVGTRTHSAIIYYRTPGLDIRFALVDEIVKSVLPSPDESTGSHSHETKKAWNAAIKGYDKLLQVRRRIAHNPILPRQDAPDHKQAPAHTEPPSWYEIYVGHNEGLRERSAKLRPLRIEELRKHHHDVIDLKRRLIDFFFNVLTSLPEAPPEPLQLI